MSVAWLVSGGRAFVARHDDAAGWAPTSAIVRLVQGIYEREPDRARWIVRGRIFASARPTRMCAGTVKVAARRITAPFAGAAPGGRGEGAIEIADVSDAYDLRRAVDVAPPGARVRSDEDAVDLLATLARQVPREGPRFRAARPFAAVLVASSGEVLRAAINGAATNRTLHAEVNLVQGFWAATGERLPRGATIYTSRKPCKMCAGFIAEAAADPDALAVRYVEDDPGCAARATCLDGRAAPTSCRAASSPF